MSDNKLNSLGFDDDDVLSSLDILKAKYAAYTDEDEETEPETQEIPAEEEESQEVPFFTKFAAIAEEQDSDSDDESDEDDSGDMFFSSFGDVDEVSPEPEAGLDLTDFMNYEKEHDISNPEDIQEEELVLDGETDEPDTQDPRDISFAIIDDSALYSESRESEEEDEDYDDIYSDDTEDEDFTDTDAEDEEYDEFADLDDDDDIVRIDAQTHEDSPFAAALKEAAQSEQIQKAKEKKDKQKKNKDGKKKHGKLPYIIVAVAVPILLWLTVFITDITLVSNWKTPLFCKNTYEYENGSRDYKGAFYQFQIHINEQGEVESVCLPWFVKGPNDSLK